MGLKIEDNCYVHNLLSTDDQVVIMRGVEDTNYIDRKLEEYEKWGPGILFVTPVMRMFIHRLMLQVCTAGRVVNS
jgi:hypothetical protein